MNKIIDSIKNLEVGEVQKHRNLAVVPLIGRDSNLDYLVLSDAINKGFKITERPNESGGPSVPNLYASNQTGKRVLSIAGEYVVGGGQNRTLVRNIYFDKQFEGVIPVTCIEQGRWNPGQAQPLPDLEIPGRVPTPGEPQRVPVGVFACKGVVPRYMAKAEQGAVWNFAGQALSSYNCSSPSSDLSEVYTQRENDFNNFKKNFSSLDGQVGAISIISKNGKRFFVTDVFDKNSTFKSYFDNLLKSYILESGLEDKSEIIVSSQEAKGFLESVDACEFRNVKPISLGDDIEIKRDNLKGSSLLFEGNFLYLNLFTPPENVPERRDLSPDRSSLRIRTGFERTII